MKAQTEDQKRAMDQARAQLDSILEMVEGLDSEDDNEREEAMERINEDALSVEIRSDWHVPGQKSEGGQYNILLCTGGPACRIIGDLNEYMEPESARIEYQDWFTPWVDYPINSDEEKAVLRYASCFYYGE